MHYPACSDNSKNARKQWKWQSDWKLFCRYHPSNPSSIVAGQIHHKQIHSSDKTEMNCENNCWSGAICFNVMRLSLKQCLKRINLLIKYTYFEFKFEIRQRRIERFHISLNIESDSTFLTYNIRNDYVRVKYTGLYLVYCYLQPVPIETNTRAHTHTLTHTLERNKNKYQHSFYRLRLKL